MSSKTRIWLVKNDHDATKSASQEPFDLRTFPTTFHAEEHTDVFYTNMAPILWLLRAIGALPIKNFLAIQDKKSELATVCLRRHFSVIMLWSACVYAALIVALWFAYSKGFLEALNSQSFDTTVIGYLDLAYHLIDLALPFTNWREAGLIAAYVASWNAFQKKYQLTTGRSLDIKLRRRAAKLSVVMVVVACTRETVYQMLENNLHNYLVLLTYMYQGTLRDAMALHWYLLCLVLQQTAQSLATSFQQDMDAATRPGAVVTRYKTLWLQLSRLVSRAGQAMCYTYSFYVLYLFLMLTVSLFGFITTLAEGLKTRLVYLVCDSLFTSAELFVVCDGANTVTREAGLTFQSKLLDIGQTSLNDQAQQEVDAFLRTIELRPPEINFGGYVVVNRGMLLSIGSMLVTYLVVLLQFEMSNGSSSEEGVNVTTVTPS